MSTATTTGNIGHITQIIGSTFDVEYAEDQLPAIYNAVKIVSDHKGVKINLTGEVQQHLGGGRVRCVALGSTDGLVRGQDCVDTGEPVKVPVGNCTLGRVFNITGDPVDGRGPVDAEEYWPIHRDPPALRDLSTKTELFETGIKVIDLLTPFVRGGKAGLFGGAGLGKTVILTELIARIATAHGGFGVRRRRRADARRHEPVARNARSENRRHGSQRYRSNVHGVRPNERAAWSPSPRRSLGPYDGRILPR